MSLFKSKFDYVLEADEQPAPAPDTDSEAMAQTLNTAKPEDFNVQAAERQKLVDHTKIAQIKTLNEWIAKIDNFIIFLNDTNSDSMQIQLHSAPCDSMFEKIATSEKKKISRLAADLGNLGQSLKGYLASAND